jgi:DNA helicase-2/ATP-dependent DNA helicase PcrA
MGFLETITLDSEKESDEFQDQQLSLMTVHGSKGLEYPFVFVVGAEETVFPSYQSLENGDMGVEEERRLFYVAMTRAMKKLFISFARARMLWGNLKFNGPSRFLDEIPENFYEWKFFNDKKTSVGKRSRSNSDSFEDDFAQETFDDDMPSIYVSELKKEKSTYPQGTTVKHSLYGVGEVVNSEGFGSDEKVVIKFNDGMRKKFMVKFAPLEKM